MIERNEEGLEFTSGPGSTGSLSQGQMKILEEHSINSEFNGPNPKQIDLLRKYYPEEYEKAKAVFYESIRQFLLAKEKYETEGCAPSTPKDEYYNLQKEMKDKKSQLDMASFVLREMAQKAFQLKYKK